MVSELSQRYLSRLRFALANPQWLPLAGLAGVLIAIGLHVFFIPAREAAIDAAEYRLDQLQRTARRLQIARASSPEAQQSNLLAELPDEVDIDRLIGRLLKLAEEQGLDIQTGEYRLQRQPDRPFDSYILNLPISAEYRALRGYLAAIREAYPMLAIDNVDLHRDSINNPTVAVQLRLVFFVKHKGKS